MAYCHSSSAFCTFPLILIALEWDVEQSLIHVTFRGSDLHCWVFVFCKDDCGLELEGKCTLLHEHNVTESRGERKERDPVSAVQWEAHLNSNKQILVCAIAHYFTGNVGVNACIRKTINTNSPVVKLPWVICKVKVCSLAQVLCGNGGDLFTFPMMHKSPIIAFLAHSLTLLWK